MAKRLLTRKAFMQVSKGDYALHICKGGKAYLIAEHKDVYYKVA